MLVRVFAGLDTGFYIDASAQDPTGVLSELDLLKRRPWMIVVRATDHDSRVGTFAQWESLLISRGYHLVHQEGDNRFYLCSGQGGLAELSSRLEESERLVASLSLSLIDTQASQRALASEKAEALADRDRALAVMAYAQEQHRVVTSSRSWWLTAPLRRLMSLMLGLRARIKRGQSGEPTKASGTDADIAPVPITSDAENILARFPVFGAADPGKDKP